MQTIVQRETEPLWFIDNLARVILDGEQTGGAMSVTEVSGRCGDMPPLHVHHGADELFYVLEGELTLLTPDREISVPAGQAALGVRDVPHAYRVESDTARWLAVTTPAGFEQFVRAASEPAPVAELPPPGREQDPNLLARLAAEQDIEILGPPGTLPQDV